MIGQAILSEAARYNDAQAEELGLPGFCRAHAIDLPGLMHVSEQRALRLVMMEKDLDPSVTEPTAVRLTPEERKRLTTYQAACIDGIAIGIRALGLHG